jgi:hypothetical protein
MLTSANADSECSSPLYLYGLYSDVAPLTVALLCYTLENSRAGIHHTLSFLQHC